MKKGKSEVILILDRSGSMSGLKTDMEGGLKTFIEKQATEPGECLVSLYQFDDVYETVFEAKDVKSVPRITITPRNSTALRDALGKTINAVGERLAKTDEADRPELVIVCVITDGCENASKEYAQTQIAEMIKHQKEKYSWQFLFLGANQDAILAGASYGVAGGTSLTYAGNTVAVTGAMMSFTSGISCMRAMAALSGSSMGINYSFTDEDRKAALAGAPPSAPQWGFNLDQNGKVVANTVP